MFEFRIVVSHQNLVSISDFRWNAYFLFDLGFGDAIKYRRWLEQLLLRSSILFLLVLFDGLDLCLQAFRTETMVDGLLCVSTFGILNIFEFSSGECFAPLPPPCGGRHK